MARHIWQSQKLSSRYKELLVEYFNLARSHGFAVRESQRYATIHLERYRQMGNWQQPANCKITTKTHTYSRWFYGTSVNASEYTYCRLLGLRTPPAYQGIKPDGRANLDIVMARQRAHGTQHQISRHAGVKALRNLFGPIGLYHTQANMLTAKDEFHTRLYDRWLRVRRGRELFIKGLGTYDIMHAATTIEEKVDPYNFMLVAYAMKYGLYRKGLMISISLHLPTILESPERLNHLKRYANFWRKYGHLDALRYAPVNTLHLAPEELLARLRVRDGRVRMRFQNVNEVYPTATSTREYEAYKEWPVEVIEDYTIRPIKTQAELRGAAKDYHNCAADYSAMLAQGDSAILTCTHNETGKAMAMAQLKKGQLGYAQLFAPCNKRVKPKVKTVMQKALDTYEDLLHRPTMTQQ